MKAMHTPGPYFVRLGKDGHFDVMVGPDEDASITLCTRVAWKGREAEMHANGNLFAAAPDLLAALQGVLRVADRQTDEFDAARAAIAKATAQ
jgi:hypothetical protein